MTARPARSTTNPIDRLWRLFVDDRALLLVLALLLAATLLALLLPQLPAAVVQEDMAGRWMAEASARFGGLGRLMQGAGLFDVWNSPWLTLLLGLLAFILLLRLAQAAGDAVKRMRQRDFRWLAAAAGLWPLAESFSLAGGLEAAAAEMADDLRSEGWQVGSQVDEGLAMVAAERSRWGLLGPPLAYAGLIILLAGLWLGRNAGWQEAGLTLVPGQPTFLDHLPGTALSLVTTEDDRQAVALQRGDGSLISRPLSASGSARLAGLTVQRTAEGLALAVSAQEIDGTPLPLQALEEQAAEQSGLNLVFDQPRAERAFLVPTRQLAFSVVAFPELPEQGFSGPTFLVQAFQVGQQQPVFNQFLAGDSTFAVEDDLYQVRSGQFVTVQVSRFPGTPLLVTGAVLAIAGLLLAALRPAGGLFLRLLPARGTAEVSARLLPSPAWRQGRRWLAAWTATYTPPDGAGQEQ